MKLWLLEQTINKNWDTFDSAVVVAETEDEARKIHPMNHKDYNNLASIVWKNNSWYYINELGYNAYWNMCWVDPHEVIVTYIGEASDKFKSGDIVCSSFIAG